MRHSKFGLVINLKTAAALRLIVPQSLARRRGHRQRPDGHSGRAGQGPQGPQRHAVRIAISNSRLVTFDNTSVTFRWKDYRANGRDRAKVMTLAIDEFIRRFLIHVLPGGFHRIRHYGLFANGGRADTIAQARQLLNVTPAHLEPSDTGGTGEAEPQMLSHPCPCCGGRMIIIETLERGCTPRHRPTVPTGIDSS